jgi:hypothetical protein
MSNYELHQRHGQLCLVKNGDIICHFTGDGRKIANEILSKLTPHSVDGELLERQEKKIKELESELVRYSEVAYTQSQRKLSWMDNAEKLKKENAELLEALKRLVKNVPRENCYEDWEYAEIVLSRREGSAPQEPSNA